MSDSEILAAKWTPRGLAQRARLTFRTPADVVLFLQIGAFLWRAPLDLDRAALPEFLLRLRRGRRRPAASVPEAMERVARLRDPWLRLKPLRSRENCFVRALTLYRFVDVDGADVRFHLGIEQRERLHGHAWISIDGDDVWVPQGVGRSGVREIFVSDRAA